jgi:hypothetical protein
MTAAWPWLTLAGLGAFHGLNPGMGWLFAVALGLHRHSRRVVLISLAPMALGHALSIWLVAAAVMALGVVIDAAALRIAVGAILLFWAAYHALYGHRHRVRIGMTTGLAGLALWSFLMATAHGAGLMLVPALMPLCGNDPGFGRGAFLMSLAAVGIHMLATLIVTGFIAFAVYSWIGLDVLRRSWINFDALWTGMLVVAGLLLIVA